MARQITVAFAVDGNRVEVPVPTQISGEVSYQTGYTFDYSRPVSDPQAKNIERVKLNAVLYDITGVLQQFQQQGAPEWYADTPYAQFARVKHGGNYYVAAVDGTEQEPGTGEEWSLDNIAAQARKNNLTATTDPTATDDESEGYEPLSQWINTVSGEVFIAITVAEGAAVWQQGTFTVDELGNVALLNANAIGQAIIQSPNPSAVRFMRANADNSVSWLSAEDFRTALSLTNTDGLPEGSTNQYFTQARVRSSTLTGFAAGVGFTAVIATDTILQALQKIQGWLSSLGTASQANLVASNTDATLGRVLTVGSGGLLGLSPYQSVYDFDATGQVMQGRTMVSLSPGTKPSANIPGFPDNCFVLPAQRSGGGNMVQLAIAFEGGYSRMAHRHYSGSSWSPWVESWTTGNTSADVQAMLGAADSAAIRSAIGAGTSNLTIGATSGTAKEGDYQPTAGETSYDNTASGLASSDVQGAIDELASTAPPAFTPGVIYTSPNITNIFNNVLGVSGFYKISRIYPGLLLVTVNCYGSVTTADVLGMNLPPSLGVEFSAVITEGINLTVNRAGDSHYTVIPMSVRISGGDVQIYTGGATGNVGDYFSSEFNVFVTESLD